MTDLTQMLRWNAGFVRGLAQSVLDRAKAIRGSLPPYSAVTTQTSAAAAKPVKKKAPTTKKSASTGARRKKKTTKRVHG